ncbi:MAG: hypothetical protein ACREP9_05285, partial [Candidatus Dormibacteraceae bacterium]
AGAHNSLNYVAGLPPVRIPYACSNSDAYALGGQLPYLPLLIVSGAGEAELPEGLAAGAVGGAGELTVDSILNEAASGTGNFDLGYATANESEQLGADWVGEGSRVASDGKTQVSSDSLRAYRPPTYKPNLGVVQSNFEQRAIPGGPYDSNGHLTILYGPLAP